MKNLKPISGPLLVFGGVYSNLQALEAIMDVAKKQKINSENIICTGDIVAYCAQPEECIQTIKKWGIQSIAGNVEIQLSTGQEDCACDFTEGSRCDSFSKQWYPFAQSQLSPNAIKWMGQLPEFLTFEYANKKIAVVHGSFHNTSEFIFKSTPWEIKAKNFEDTNADVVLAGHCGLPFSQSKNGKYWLNPGVIGMPANDGTPRVWYMILEDKNDQLSFKHHALDYDYKKANQMMQDKNLTLEYAKTLITGLWDNCEILPEKETNQQAISLAF